MPYTNSSELGHTTSTQDGKRIALQYFTGEDLRELRPLILNIYGRVLGERRHSEKEGFVYSTTVTTMVSAKSLSLRHYFLFNYTLMLLEE